jgi:hypothetical protein
MAHFDPVMAHFDGARIGPGGVAIFPDRRRLACLEQKFPESDASRRPAMVLQADAS